MSNYSNQGYELGWDDEISQESEDFKLFEPGEYEFEVIAFERARWQGSDKIPPCNMAIVSLKFTDDTGSATVIKERLKMYSSVEWLLSAFFTAIGQKKKGEPLKMNWGAVIGARGRARLNVREYTTNDGQERKINNVERFLEPEPAKAAPTFQAGTF